MNFGITSLKLVALAVFVFIQSGCPLRKNEMRPIGPEVKQNLVIFFKPGLTDEQVEGFLHEVLSKPDPNGKGFYLRRGISEFSRIHAVQGHEGVAISFFSYATKEEREAVVLDVKSSAMVYKVLENTAPAEVKELDHAKSPSPR